MTDKPYLPREGSVAQRVLSFLAANPDEQLTAGDVAAKFDCLRNNVHSLLSGCVNAGLLARVEDASESELVYRLGSGKPKPAWPTAPEGISAHRPFGNASGKPADAPDAYRIDVDKIAIDCDVPLSRGGSGIAWGRLFDRMRPGDSCLLPEQVRSNLSKAIAKSKTTGTDFAIRKVDGGIRVWRTK